MQTSPRIRSSSLQDIENITVFEILPLLREKLPIAQLHWLSRELPDAHPNDFANSIAAKSIFYLMKDTKFLKN